MMQKKIEIDEIGLEKSRLNESGVRYRAMRRKENDRWRLMGLSKTKNGLYYISLIYTLDQALERGIKFRENWKQPSDEERIYLAPNVFFQPEDWIVTEISEPIDTFWVMQVLWRNEHPQAPYIRTPVGAFGIRSAKPLHACDTKFQYAFGYQPAYQKPGASISVREHLLIYFIVQLILKYGYYNKTIVRMAYNSAYSNSASWQKLLLIMRSEKIMGHVAEELKKHLNDKGLEMDWVFDQLKDMGEKDYDRLPERRLEVVRLVGRMNNMPMFDRELVTGVPALNEAEYAEAEEVETDLKRIAG